MLIVAQFASEGTPISQWIVLGAVAALAVLAIIIGRKKQNC